MAPHHMGRFLGGTPRYTRNGGGQFSRATVDSATIRVCDECRRFRTRERKVSPMGHIIPGEYTKWSACDCPPVEAT